MQAKLFFVLFPLLLIGCTRQPSDEPDLASMNWQEIERLAEGSEVNLIMWMGDPFINAYMRDYVTPVLKDQFGISLNIGSGQGNQIVSMLMTELEAGKAQSEIDMVWINGETFYQLRQIKGLYGPFTDMLPNAQYIDFENPFIGIDFQQPVDGYEAPWGNVQLALIYDTTRVTQPPRNRNELATWVEANPGQFTFDNGFTGMTFLKSLLIDIAGGKGALDGPFDEVRYAEASAKLWQYINEIKPYFWKEGETYPNSVAPMHQMFANGELAFTMSNNDGEVDNKVIQGLFPESAKAFVLDSGTIQNSHYMGIVSHASNKAGALVAINFLISAEAQYRKYNPEIWGDGTVLAIDRLPTEWQEKFSNIPTRKHAPKRSSIQDKALKELAPEYMISLYEDFRTEVLGQ